MFYHGMNYTIFTKYMQGETEKEPDSNEKPGCTIGCGPVKNHETGGFHGPLPTLTAVKAKVSVQPAGNCR